ncbi:hypothetical protein [Paenibacillus jilunlii]|nr:hypothetical protein [Paenibacillus jilunlii]
MAIVHRKGNNLRSLGGLPIPDFFTKSGLQPSGDCCAMGAVTIHFREEG